jgi:hypothetical protein
MWPIRVEQDGATVIAIALSQDLDPAGEVTGGGYWILRSTDGGVSWDRVLYTGIRPMQPYVILSLSHLPMAAGDRLHIEAEVRELDTSEIRFPPMSRSFKNVRTGFFLDVAWADLERDRDGDGLTDLAEERLLTDPSIADTDEDGLPDGVDPFPHISCAAPPTSRSPVYMEAIVALERQNTPANGKDAAPLSGATFFVVADRGEFAGLPGDRRVIVLSPAEAALAQGRFGVHYPAALHLYIDHEGTRALVIWDEHWRGMTLHVNQNDGTWKLSPSMSWWVT